MPTGRNAKPNRMQHDIINLTPDTSSRLCMWCLVVFLFGYTAFSIVYGITAHTHLEVDADIRTVYMDNQCNESQLKRHGIATPPPMNCTKSNEVRITCLDVYASTNTCGPAVNHTLGEYLSQHEYETLDCDAFTKTFTTISGAHDTWIAVQIIGACVTFLYCIILNAYRQWHPSTKKLLYGKHGQYVDT